MKLIEKNLVEAIIQIIANGTHPNINFTQISQVLRQLQELKDAPNYPILTDPADIKDEKSEK